MCCQCAAASHLLHWVRWRIDLQRPRVRCHRAFVFKVAPDLDADLLVALERAVKRTHGSKRGVCLLVEVAFSCSQQLLHRAGLRPHYGSTT